MHLTKKTKQLTAASLGVVFLCLYVLTTNPRTLPAPFLLVPPLAVFGICLVVVRVALGAFTQLDSARLKAIMVALAALPALLLMLATAGQLGLKDAVLTIVFVIGLTWYFDRSRQNQKDTA
jgi:hypothetical protein